MRYLSKSAFQERMADAFEREILALTDLHVMLVDIIFRLTALRPLRGDDARLGPPGPWHNDAPPTAPPHRTRSAWNGSASSPWYPCPGATHRDV